MKRKTIYPLILIGLVVMTGCRSSREATRPQAAPEAPARTYTVMTYSATVDGMSVNGQVRMAQDSIIWLNASKFIEVGRALATPDSVWVNVPLMGQRLSGDYNDVSRKARMKVSFNDLQEMLESPDAEERIATLTRRMGYEATIRINKRERVKSLTFPFNKQ